MISADVAREVSFADLLVIDVEEHLDVGRTDGLQDHGGVLRADDELAGMIDQDVKGSRMIVIPSGSTILAPALSAAMTAAIWSSRE